MLPSGAAHTQQLAARSETPPARVWDNDGAGSVKWGAGRPYGCRVFQTRFGTCARMPRRRRYWCRALKLYPWSAASPLGRLGGLFPLPVLMGDRSSSRSSARRARY
jgi:hypothetical protein